jgi:hypothetical protein
LEMKLNVETKVGKQREYNNAFPSKKYINNWE